MHNPPDLADAMINGHDRIIIELVQPLDSPAFIAVAWPLKTSVSTCYAIRQCWRGHGKG
jgi:hypothetical protein